ncbi:hypothetical protein BDR04DRAFT_1089786 [Suillus decipiens]|nr:hypothetical protein BDR04DRAFT_1089786 [Suillus decipiens]
MNFSILAVIVASTASIFVSAQCGQPGDSCDQIPCCGNYVCNITTSGDYCIE